MNDTKKSGQDRILAVILIILCGIGINFAGVRLATSLDWWLYLDSVGTILAALTGGLLPGIIVGFASNFINGFSDPITLYYGIISVLIALVAVLMNRCGMFSHPVKAVGASFCFALIGGCLGSLLTWLLYGLDFGSGISSTLALDLYNNYAFAKPLAQLSADFVLDLADKFITVAIVCIVLRLMPQKLKDRISGSGLLFGGQTGLMKNKRLFGSLRSKVVVMIAVTAAILSTIAVTISFLIYKEAMDERYVTTGREITNIMAEMIDGDKIDDYLSGKESADGYAELENQLCRLADNVSDIKYMYVYKIMEDGCHVVFDLDTDELEGAEPGSVQEFDEDFAEYLPALMKGEEIEPVISNGDFGWLLTVYNPITDSDGSCAAYAAVDIAMESLMDSRYVFVIRMISLLFGASIIIIAFAVLYAQKRIVDPIDSLTDAANHFAFDNESDRRTNTQMIQGLNISTGDEIENLYGAITKTVTDMSGYIDMIADKNALITKMQDNIIMSFATMVENRDENTGQHIRRTAEYVGAIGKELLRAGKYKDILDKQALFDYEKSAPLHDIGKIKIPDYILNKPGKLTDEEFEIIKTHTTEGGIILRSAMKGIENNGYLNCAVNMATCHHEKWDGSGYPKGLSGEDIPLCARIMALADVFDALTSRRSYKEAFSVEKAKAIIIGESGTHFDPVVTEAFLKVLPTLDINMNE